jgi:glutamate/tyrosine decarboxylase-like PLP-dependent enzyme
MWTTGVPRENNGGQQMQNLLNDAAARAGRYLKDIPGRRVPPTSEAVAGLDRLDVPWQQEPLDPARVLAELDETGSPATLASAGGRFFGFVVGGCLPAALAANVLAGAWDQNGAYQVLSPASARLEAVAMRWLIECFGLPAEAGAGFVTGATMANFSALAAARHALLAREGWDVGARGLFGAPEITVIVGQEVHASVLKALNLLGFGRERVVRVPADGQGRMIADRLPPIDGPTIVCIQAGNVNTGAFDPAAAVCARAHEAGAWVHTDGAFGLWALAASERAPLAAGFAQADSWAVDAHKWLNVPHDSAVVFVRDPEHLRAAMAESASYLVELEGREPCHYTPEFSRRGRGIEIWAALRSLGKSGLADQIERCCRLASRFAEGLRAAGHTVLNEVVLNQVMVDFGSPERTRAVIQRLQAEGLCWFGPTVWQGHTAMRISVSSYATTEADVDLGLEAIFRAAAD